MPSPEELPSKTEFQHPTIGSIQSLQEDGVLSFLGIKYASLRHWFDNATMPTYNGDGLQAQDYGPQALADPGAIDLEDAAIQKALPKPASPGMSGTECLNLNIAIPSTAVPSSRLPVLVYIHGGGFSAGANWWPQYDLKPIVRLSSRKGKPVVAVNINYRLGVPGFLSSKELRQAGYQDNRGLHDQLTALRWIKEYISGFGGDPALVTVLGESAGGLSTARLLYTDEPLFSHIVVLGGAPPSMQPLDPGTAEVAYSKVIETLNIESLSPEDRIKSLTKASDLDLQLGFRLTLPFLPVLDNNLVPFTESFDLMESPGYLLKNRGCKGAMIVYSSLDASIFHFMGFLHHKDDVAESFSSSIRSSLKDNPAEAERLLRAYGISPGLDRPTALVRVLEFGSDICHQFPARVFAEKVPCDAFVLQFSEPNPFEGPFKGHSTHILDVAFLFQNYSHYLDEQQRAAAGQFAEDVLDLAYGREPWKTYSSNKGIAVLGDGRRRYVEGSHSGTKCTGELREIASQIGLDALLRAWNAFLF